MALHGLWKRGEIKMLDYKTRKYQAQGYYQVAMKRVEREKEPTGQKFSCGSRVKIADDLGDYMKHFPSGCNATVEYVYAHAYSGDNITSYRLNVDGHGSIAWYEECQLTQI